jgi:phosphate transport system substrate-binding protein
MKNFRRPYYVLVLFFCSIFLVVKKSEGEKETILKGTATILVDDSKTLLEDDFQWP